MGRTKRTGAPTCRTPRACGGVPWRRTPAAHRLQPHPRLRWGLVVGRCFLLDDRVVFRFVPRRVRFSANLPKVRACSRDLAATISWLPFHAKGRSPRASALTVGRDRAERKKGSQNAFSWQRPDERPAWDCFRRAALITQFAPMLTLLSRLWRLKVASASSDSVRPHRAATAVDYLVDPASNHMLVSKIKPCMSKYMPK